MVRRRSLILGAAVALVAAAPAQATSRKIAIGDFQWSPHDVTVSLNDTVEWFWVGPDLQHSVTGTSANALRMDSDPGRTPEHGPGDRFTLKFTVPGTYEFHCKLHQIVGGTVTVLGTPGDGAPSPDPDPVVRIDTTPPVIDGVSVRGTRGRQTVKYTLDEAGKVTVDLEKRRGRRWVFVTSRILVGHVGYNEGRIRGRLTKGRWRMFLRAADAENNQSRDAVATFTVR